MAAVVRRTSESIISSACLPTVRKTTSPARSAELGVARRTLVLAQLFVQRVGVGLDGSPRLAQCSELVGDEGIGDAGRTGLERREFAGQSLEALGEPGERGVDLIGRRSGALGRRRCRMA